MGADAAAGSLNEQRDESLAIAIKEEARRIGFDLVGITSAASPGGLADFRDWLSHGYDGEMGYLSRREEAYSHPNHVLPAVRSVIMLAVNYRTSEPAPTGPLEGRVSRYAWNNTDYHDILRGRTQQLADFLHELCPGCRTRSIVDTAPFLERDFARTAGLGWFGKNTMLINKRQGSWFFLASLLTDIDLPADAAHDTAHCGTCTRCLEACPTQAFPEPYVLDARRCIAYLTIELKGPIPEALREGTGEWLFGCDICQDVCPWNKKAVAKDDLEFRPQGDLDPADLIRLLDLSPEEFVQKYKGTPLDRPGRAGLLRNAAIVLGNKRDPRANPALARAVNDSEPLVRGAAAWALGKIGGDLAVAALKSRLSVEDNATVLHEIDQALSALLSSQEAQT